MKQNNGNITMIPSKGKESNGVTINMENELTIFSIESLKDHIIEAVKKYNNIHVNMKNVKNMDLTFIQLLYSMKNYALSQNKKFIINAELSGDMKTLFNNSDLTKVLV